jgi:hypothetical protein
MSSCFDEKADGGASDELDFLDQKIINTLQKIDNNFSEAHQASTVLLGKVQQFEVEIKQVHNGLKVWKRFFHNFNGAEASDMKQKIDKSGNKRPISSISTMQGEEEETGDGAISGGSKHVSSHNSIATSSPASKLNSSDGGLNFSINMSPPKTTCFLRHRIESNNNNNANTTTTFMNDSTSYTGMNGMETPSVSKRAKLTTCMYILYSSLSNKPFFFLSNIGN